MENLADKKLWRPNYPHSQKQKVLLENSKFSTSMLSNVPYIQVFHEDLEEPACFWLDATHVYLRLNWGKWGTVGTENPMLLEVVGQRHYCQVFSIYEGEVKDRLVPVYRINELPPELFSDAATNFFISSCRVLCQSDGTSSPKNYYHGCVDQILSIVKEISGELTVSDGTNLGASPEEVVVISNNKQALILHVIAHSDECITTCFCDPETRSSFSDEKVHALKYALARLQPNWFIETGVFTIASVKSEILCRLMFGHGISMPDEINDLVFTFDDLGEELVKFFFSKQD